MSAWPVQLDWLAPLASEPNESKGKGRGKAVEMNLNWSAKSRV